MKDRKQVAEPKQSLVKTERIAAAKDLKTQWWEDVDVALRSHGIDPRTANVLELRRRFGIEHLIDREGMRLVLLHKRAPRVPGERKAILDAIRQTDIAPKGVETAELGLQLLKEASPFYEVQASRVPRAEIRMDSRLERGEKKSILLRFIDDPPAVPGSVIADHDTIREHINAAAQIASSGEASIVHIITWNMAAVEELADEASARGVQLRSVVNFLSSFFSVEKARSYFDDQRSLKIGPRTILRASEVDWLPLEWTLNGKTYAGDANLQHVLGIDHDPEEVDSLPSGHERICVVFGKTGTGKSSLVYQSANKLLDRWIEGDVLSDGGACQLPVVVRGRDIGLVRTFDALAAAVAYNIGLQYEVTLPVSTIKFLIQRGYIHVMIDSLEETPGFNSLEELQAFISHLEAVDPLKATFLITSRAEIFPLEEQNQLQKIHDSGRLRWIVLKSISTKDVDDRSKHLLQLASATSRSKDLVLPALKPLLGRPLFYRVLSDEVGREKLTRLGVTAWSEHHAIEQNCTLYEMFGQLANRWALQVTDGCPKGEFEIEPPNFLQLCTALVGVFFELAIANGLDLKNQMKRPLDEILERLALFHWQPTPTVGDKKPLAVAELERYLSYSTIFCRKTDSQVREGELCFPSTGMMVYFLAEYLTEPFLGTAHEAIKNARLLIERLSAVNLETLRIPYDDAETGEPSAEGATPLLLMFVSGLLRVKRLSDRLGFLLNDISNNGHATDQQDQMQSLALSSVRAPNTLCDNLVYLNAHSTPQVDKGISQQSRPFWYRRRSADLLLYVAKDNAAQEFIRGGLSVWNHGSAILGECRIVLGGQLDVGKYDNDYEQRLLKKGSYPAPGLNTALVPPFLIQHAPVSNLAFLHFLRSKAGRSWDPISVRDSTRNDYYLRTWDYVLGQVDWDEWLDARNSVATLVRSTLSKLSPQQWHDWFRAPVTYVNWPAARAFAEWVHCRLPTEAEYEAAARACQHNELASDAAREDRKILRKHLLGSDIPWVSCFGESGGALFECDKALKGFTLRFGSNSKMELFRKFFPYITTSLDDATALAEDDLVGKVPEWEQQELTRIKSLGVPEDIAALLVPARHLVGAIRYWMEDAWNPFWPPVNSRDESGDTEVLVAPYQDGWSSTGSEPTGDAYLSYLHRCQSWREGRQRVLRGTSLQMADSEKRISYRESQRESNVNPDLGFRCVQPIWPNRSVDYPAVATLEQIMKEVETEDGKGK